MSEDQSEKYADLSEKSKKKLVILGHCILNMNARAPGISIHEGVVMDIFRALKRMGVAILQYPCPETSFCGLRRWWQVYEQYDNVNYRRHAKRIADDLASIAKNYFVEGYEVFVIGLGISPSCGVRLTQSDPSWGGRPKPVSDEAPIKHGPGVFIEELLSALRRHGIAYSAIDLAPVLIYPPKRASGLPVYPSTWEEAVKEIERHVGGS